MDVGGAGACFPFPTPTPARFFGLCPLLLRHCVNLSLDKDQGAAAYLEEVSLSPHAPFTEPGATSPLICLGRLEDLISHPLASRGPGPADVPMQTFKD